MLEVHIRLCFIQVDIPWKWFYDAFFYSFKMVNKLWLNLSISLIVEYLKDISLLLYFFISFIIIHPHQDKLWMHRGWFCVYLFTCLEWFFYLTCHRRLHLPSSWMAPHTAAASLCAAGNDSPLRRNLRQIVSQTFCDSFWILWRCRLLS